MFFSRMNPDERVKLQETKRSIFLWEPLSYLYGTSKQVLTQVFFSDYSPPPTFSNPHNTIDGIVDNPKDLRYNLDKRCSELQNNTNLVVNTQLSKSNVIVLLGDDFTGSN